MINTEKKIQDTFIKLLEKYNLEEIDVNMICKELNIQRQTFYYHFKNIYDVIYSIYVYQKIGDYFDNSLNSIVNNVFVFLFKDQTFNTTVAKSNCYDVLKDFVSVYVNNTLTKMLDVYNLRINDKKEIARFYSRAISEQCIYYFVQGEYSIKEGCLKMSYLFNEDTLKTIIRKYQNSIA
jgi:Transcriptional regulator